MIRKGAPWRFTSNTFFEKRVDQLFDLAGQVEAAFAAAGLEYRVIGGLAVYLWKKRSPTAGASRGYRYRGAARRSRPDRASR
jgi:hypothetical protein